MILLMDTEEKCQCEAIRVNLFPNKIANDTSSTEDKEEIVQLARRMGSYIVTLQNGLVGQLIDPNTILAILPNPVSV